MILKSYWSLLQTSCLKQNISKMNRLNFLFHSRTKPVILLIVLVHALSGGAEGENTTKTIFGVKHLLNLGYGPRPFQIFLGRGGTE